MLVQFVAANTDRGGDSSRLLAVLPDGPEYLAEQLRGLTEDSVRLRAPISQPRQLNTDCTVAPFGQQIQFVEPMCESHCGDFPDWFGAQDLGRRGIAQAL